MLSLLVLSICTSSDLNNLDQFRYKNGYLFNCCQKAPAHSSATMLRSSCYKRHFCDLNTVNPTESNRFLLILCIQKSSAIKYVTSNIYEQKISSFMTVKFLIDQRVFSSVYESNISFRSLELFYSNTFHQVPHDIKLLKRFYQKHSYCCKSQLQVFC